MDDLVKKVNALIVNIGRGRTHALGELYTLTSGYLLAMAKSYLANKSEAEDVVSEVYLRVAKSADAFDRNRNGLNWLFKITKNIALNMNDGAARRRTEDIDAHYDIADVFSVLDDFNLCKQSLSEAVAELDLYERRLIYLRYWEGYTIREIAADLNKPVMTVNDNLKRILKILRKKL